MTAVLNDIRQLDAARRRGEISPAEYAAARRRLLEAIPDADNSGAPEPAARHKAPRPNLTVLAGALCLIFGLITALATWITGDLSLGLTLSITLLAALTVTAFRGLTE